MLKLILMSLKQKEKSPKTSTNEKLAPFDYFPPVLRFLVLELANWIIYFILAITKDFLWLIPLLLIIISHTVFNVKGDKKFNGPILVPGWIRAIIEIGFLGSMLVIGCFILFEPIASFIAVNLVIAVVVYDRNRYAWLMNYSKEPPLYVKLFATKK